MGYNQQKNIDLTIKNGTQNIIYVYIHTQRMKGNGFGCPPHRQTPFQSVEAKHLFSSLNLLTRKGKPRWISRLWGRTFVGDCQDRGLLCQFHTTIVINSACQIKHLQHASNIIKQNQAYVNIILNDVGTRKVTVPGRVHEGTPSRQPVTRPSRESGPRCRCARGCTSEPSPGVFPTTADPAGQSHFKADVCLIVNLSKTHSKSHQKSDVCPSLQSFFLLETQRNPMKIHQNHPKNHLEITSSSFSHGTLGWFGGFSWDFPRLFPRVFPSFRRLDPSQHRLQLLLAIAHLGEAFAHVGQGLAMIKKIMVFMI